MVSTKSPNNKSVTWLYLVRLPGDASLGLSVSWIKSGPRETKLHCITHVDPVGPAARAGIRQGESIVAYSLTSLTKEHASWKSETLDELNAHTPEALIAVQVRQQNKLVGIWKTRALMITKLRLRKRRELHGKDPLGEWTVDEKVIE
ncbi:hypothetical protein V7S43_000150 [Phytophthora oleae]|uniref:PDZ domain-containing protein n=1 Tax=Phytophthora oleae TaxID=2107226 RepID=A0ABD3G4V7_9STRA